MTRQKFITFENLEVGAYFFARGKFHCKESLGFFQIPINQPERTFNAFYFDGPVGKWAYFNDGVLVRLYDESIHGQPADIVNLRSAHVQ